MLEFTVAEIATVVDGSVEGDNSTVIRGIAPLESAGPDRLSFVANARYAGYLQDTRAGAILVSPEFAAQLPDRLTRIVVADPHVALYRALTALHEERRPPPGVHPTAVVGDGVEVGEGVAIAPYAVIGAGSTIGARTRIGAHVVIGEGCRIGADCILQPHATLYDGVVMGDRCTLHSGARLGSDGFGYVWLNGGHRKVPQVGGCIVGDDVEIGANVTIDRGSIGDTVIGAGTKIDNLVQLGHNVKVGRHAMIVSQVGVSGSTTVGDGAILGGQAGVGGHLSIGAGARVGGQAGVTADIPAGQTYSGYPARPHREALRAQGMVSRLPDLLKRVRAIEKAIFGGSD